MSRWLGILVFLLLPVAGSASPVKVTTGEHQGFTRLVLEFAAPVDWKVGRTSDGYQLSVPTAGQIFDLSGVFDAIGKGRLAAIWADPATGALNIGIACACHAIPFEFRPGIVVIDLKDGPPPKGSSFELALDGSETPALSPRPPPRPKPRPGALPTPIYDWKTAALGPRIGKYPAAETGAAAPATAIAAGMPAATPSLLNLRDTLLHQLSRGAAQGVVDMALPAAQTGSGPSPGFPSLQVRIGDAPGISTSTGLSDHADLASDGQNCIDAASLDFAAWGDERPVYQQIGEAMAGLTGEFDRPDPVALTRAVRFYLYLGFGVEARQLLEEFPADLPDAAIWRSLAYLLDEEEDPAPAFADLASCASSAALWALLSDPVPAQAAKPGRDAALLAFSALPSHLRRQLGARLAGRFLDQGDPEAARAVRDAILRAPGEAGVDVALLQARMEMAAGKPASAESTVRDVLADPGPQTGEALIALTEARVAQSLPVAPELVSGLEAIVREHRRLDDEPRYLQALVLARAASGDFDAAFAGLDTAATAAPDVWRLLAQLGQDDAVLNHAIVAESAPLPAVALTTAEQLARRLLGLGFADAALRWLVPENGADPVLVATAQLMRHDANGALRALSGAETPEALPLRAEAWHMLGDEAAAARTYALAGDSQAEWRAMGRSRNWEQIAKAGPKPWQAAAAAVSPVPVQPEGQPSNANPPLPGTPAASPVETAAANPDEGPLAKGHALLEGSAATRDAVATLLATLSVPQPTQP